MLGDYVLHFPVTDFAVSLLAVAALIELGRIFLRRPQWATAVDILLLLGFGGAMASVLTGLWLTSAGSHPHTRALDIHHWFAYGTLGVSAVAVAARAFEARSGKLATVKTVALVISAALVSGAGFYGGKMAHGDEAGHSHDGAAMPDDHATPGASHTSTGDHAMPAAGSAATVDGGAAGSVVVDAGAPAAPPPTAPASRRPHSADPHSH